jgi:hypothetical protein
VPARAQLRQAQGAAAQGRRSIEDLWTRIGTLLDAFSPEECAAYFRHDGYGAI